jgi:hypothetical protein
MTRLRSVPQERYRNANVYAKSGVTRRASVCNQYREANHDKHEQDVVSTNLQALFVGERRMRWWRRNNIRYGSYPTCSGGQGVAKSSQLSRITKGCCEVQQLQSFRSSELVPNR